MSAIVVTYRESQAATSGSLDFSPKFTNILTTWNKNHVLWTKFRPAGSKEGRELDEVEQGAGEEELITQEDFDDYTAAVTDAMTSVLQPFVTPLSHGGENNVWLVGTGTYVNFDNKCLIITCRHCLDEGGFDHGFYRAPEVYTAGSFAKASGLDAALIYVPAEIWNGATHEAKMLTPLAFADRFEPADNEVFFLMGYAGENSKYGFEILDSTATCYGSQLSQKMPPDEKYFHLQWRPGSVRVTPATSDEVRKFSKADNPRGLSGALVWDTGFVRTFGDDGPWTPDIARVVGIAERWDDNTETLLVRRIENVMPWIEKVLGLTEGACTI